MQEMRDVFFKSYAMFLLEQFYENTMLLKI